MILVYAAAKFLAYGMWCDLGVRLVQPGAASLAVAARLGATRWFIGLGFGIGIFFLVGSIDASDAARLYFLIYSPVRAIEWGIMAFLIGRRLHQESRSAATVTLAFWCVGGIFVSFLTDLVSPEALQSRFCVGRCLC